MDMDICIYMGTGICLSQGYNSQRWRKCVHLFIYLFIYCIHGYTGITGLMALGFSSKLLASCTSGSRVVDRTCNLEGSTRVGVGGAHIYTDVYSGEEGSWDGGDLYSNRNPDTHSETHTDRGTDTHRHALSRSPVFHSIGALTLI